MKQKFLLIIAVVLLLTFTVNLTACGNVSAETPGEKETISYDSNTTESRDEEVTSPETDENVENTSDETEEGTETLVPPVLTLREPDRGDVPSEVTLELANMGYGVIENAEGEKMTYALVEGEEGLQIQGDMEVLDYTYGAVTQPVYSSIKVRYSDSYKLTTDCGRARFSGTLSVNNCWWWHNVVCTGNGEIEILLEKAGDKVIVSGDNMSYYLHMPSCLFYFAPNDPEGRPRIRGFSVEGVTNGSVTLEKKEDGWYLSGAEGEIILYVFGSDEYFDFHNGEVEIHIDAPADGVIHIEEYIPEVQELYR